MCFGNEHPTHKQRSREKIPVGVIKVCIQDVEGPGPRFVFMRKAVSLTLGERIYTGFKDPQKIIDELIYVGSWQ